MSYEIFRKLYICAVMLQKGTLVSSMKKKKFWPDVIYFTFEDCRFTKNMPQKNSAVLISF